MKHKPMRQGQTTKPGSLMSLAYHVTLKMQEMGPTFIVFIPEDFSIQPFADIIKKAAHSPQLFKDPECWSSLGSNL